MNAKELVSYFNGAVELAGKLSLDEEATTKLIEKLKDVKVDDTLESNFCTWFKGFLDANESTNLNNKQFGKILNKLEELIQPQNEPKYGPIDFIDFPIKASDNDSNVKFRC